MGKLRALLARLEPAWMPPIRKAVGSLLGGATGVGVAEVLNVVGIHLPLSVDGAIAVALATTATYWFPGNRPKTPALKVVPPAPPAGREKPTPPAA